MRRRRDGETGPAEAGRQPRRGAVRGAGGLADLAATSPRVLGLRQLQAAADASPTVTTQRRYGAGAEPLQLNGFEFDGHAPDKTRISGQEGLNDLVEEMLDEHFDGYRGLFMQGTQASSPGAWRDLIFGSIDEDEVELQGLGRAEVGIAVRAIKDKNRGEVLLHIARSYVYGTGEAPYSVDNLKERMLGAGAYLEPADDDALEAIFDTDGGFAQTKVAVAPGNIELSDEDNIVVLMDDHQNKHQRTKIPQFKPYTGEPGTKFAVGKDLQWHVDNTVPVVRGTVAEAMAAGLVGPDSASHAPAKDAIGGIIYDLLISYDTDTGKYVGTYHCNPVADE